MRKMACISTLVLATGVVACSSHKVSPLAAADAGGAVGGLSPEQASQVLARVGDHAIVLGDYVAALQHMDQFDRVRYSAPARRRELLDEMIDVMLLADEAREKGYDKDPATQQEIREILRDAILKKARERAPAPNDIPVAEVQAYFEAHKGDFRDPERRRISAVVLRTLGAATAALDTALKASAAQWGELVRARSAAIQAKDDGPPELAGDLGFVSPPGDARGHNPRVPEEVRVAVFEITNTGDVFPRVVPAAGSFYVVKLESKTDAHDRTLQDVERTIRVKLAQDKARASEDALLDELRKQYPVEVDDGVLAEVKVDARRPDGGGP
jgi:peptidyl-prolyl cis-trans isomerase C